jgi:hypothetical protein
MSWMRTPIPVGRLSALPGPSEAGPSVAVAGVSRRSGFLAIV